ncbi:MAG TPA: 50S ribosomal protein L32 [Verrucomicrobiales bacterium]|nr:50S ribosomal protein L32 [Verrucomicrobiales bacterium]
MAVPKRRTSKMKSRHRRAANRWSPPAMKHCPECHAAVLSHIVCPHCGFYRGRQVLSVERD